MKSTILYIVLVTGILVMAGATVLLTRAVLRGTAIETRDPPPAARTDERHTDPVRGRVTIDIPEKTAPSDQPPQPEEKTKKVAGTEQYDAKLAQDKTGKVTADSGSAKVKQGIVSYVYGAAAATDKAGESRILKLKSSILPGDTLSTGKKSKLEVRFPDDTTLSIGAKTTIAVDSYLFSEAQKEKNGMSVRIIKGICRFVTGAATKLNPDNFSARTSLMTIGIRGCDFAVESAENSDSVYVIDLADTESVTVTAAQQGQEVTDIAVDKGVKLTTRETSTVRISEERTAVTVTRGKGINRPRNMSLEETRQIIDRTSRLVSASYQMKQNAGETVFTVRPKQRESNK